MSAARTGTPAKVKGRMQLFLYRTLDSDDEGVPYDHGVTRAEGIDQAAEQIQERLLEIGVGSSGSSVRVYPLDDTDAPGVLGSGVLENRLTFRDFQIRAKR